MAKKPTKKPPKTAPRKETKPERRSNLPAGVLRKFQGTLRKDEVIRNINGVSYVIKRRLVTRRRCTWTAFLYIGSDLCRSLQLYVAHRLCFSNLFGCRVAIDL